jgi:ABC-type antimicrobial peptide transport system permease subunit
VLAPLREEIRSLAPGVPLVDVAPLSRFVAADLWLERASALLLGAFGLLASVLAAVGMYGVVNQSVSRRRGELAIRMVVGASAENVLCRVVADGMTVVALGVVAGSALSALALRLSTTVSSQLFGVAAFDPFSWVGAALLLAAVALVSCYLPARSAAAIDPAAVLASE